MGGGEGRFSAPRRSAGSPLFLKGAIWLRCLLPFPRKGRAGCLWTCRGGNGLFPAPGSGHGPFLRKKMGAVLCCGGGRLRGRMFGRWEGPVFLVPGTLSPERSHSIWRYHLCLFRKRGGTSLGAMGNGWSSPGGQQRDKRVWRRHSPSPEKEGERATRRAEGPSLPAPGPTAGDPLRGAGGCSRQTGREDHRLFNGGRSLPARGRRETGKTGLQITGPAGVCWRCDRVPPHLARRFRLIHPLFPHLCNCATD